MLVMFYQGIDGQAVFRRSVRDGAGAIVRTLEFPHRQPVLLEGEDLAAVRGDIGHALAPVYLREKDGKPLYFTRDELVDGKTVSVSLASAAERDAMLALVDAELAKTSKAKTDKKPEAKSADEADKKEKAPAVR